MIDNKYTFTKETKEYNGRVLKRIVALKDFGIVKKGDIGGWIENKKNLSQKGNCWVYDNAKVSGNAKVYSNAQVYDNAQIYGKARVYGYAQVFGKAEVFSNVQIFSNAQVSGNVWILSDAKVYDNAQVFGNVWISGDAQVYGTAQISDYTQVYGNAQVSGDAQVSGYTKICDGQITKTSDYLTLGPQGSRNSFTTYNRITNSIICGCFKGSLEDFIKQVEETYPNEDNEYRQQYELIIKHFKKL